MKKTILFSLILYSLSLQISTAQNYELNQVTQAEIAIITTTTTDTITTTDTTTTETIITNF